MAIDMSEHGRGLNEAERAWVNHPTESASGLPSRAYTSAEFFAYEREHLFERTWTCIGQACTVPEPGCVRPVRLAGLPLLMLRNASGEVRVFHNVCSHRGNELVWTACRVAGGMRCPYHAWTYDLEGRLRGTPHIGGPGAHRVAGFEPERHGLRPVRAAVWMDLVFVNVSGSAPPFETHIAPLEERLHRLAPAAEYERLRPAGTHGTLELDVAANWKLCMENNLDAYHLPWVHPDLNSYSRLEDHYEFDGGDLFAGQGSHAYAPDHGDNPPFPALRHWHERRAEYPTLYPNVFVGVQRDHLWSMVVEPIAVDRTAERLQIYYLDEAADAPRYEGTRVAQLRAWTKVFTEDVGVVEGMQRGRLSPAFSGGVFSAAVDRPTHHFNRWVANALARP